LNIRGHGRVINWPNFNIVVSQGIQMQEERDRDRGTAGQWNNHSTHESIKFSIICGWGSQSLKTIITSEITVHLTKYNNNENI